MKYFEELKKAMSLLAEHPKTLFIGQAVEYEGTGLFDTMAHLPANKKLELPVAEYFSIRFSKWYGYRRYDTCFYLPKMEFLINGC